MGLSALLRLPRPLRTRFRVATLLLVVPLVGAGVVGAVGAMVSARASSALSSQSDDSAEIEALQAVPGEIRAVVKEILAKEGAELDVAEADVIVTGTIVENGSYKANLESLIRAVKG